MGHPMAGAAVTLMAMGGSTNALIHLVAMAGRAGIKFPLELFNDFSAKTPLLPSRSARPARPAPGAGAAGAFWMFTIGVANSAKG